MLNTKRMRFPIDIILVCIRWYEAYPLGYRHIEEMMQERGMFVDHSSINRWAVRFLPLLEKAFRKHKRPVGGSWRMDETYIKVKGVWKYLYRAVDKEGKTVDFLMTAKRDKAAANRFFKKASVITVNWRRSRWTKVGPIKQPSMGSMMTGSCLSRFVKSSTSTILSSKIIVPSNAWPSRCSTLNPFAQPEMCWPVSNWFIWFAKVKWQKKIRCLLQNNFTHWQDKSAQFKGLAFLLTRNIRFCS